MNRFQARAAQAPRPLVALVMVSLLGLGGYWWFTYSGLYRALAEFQLHQFHSYYPKYTGIFTLLVTLIPGVVLIQVIGGLRGTERGPAAADALAAQRAAGSARVSNWIQTRRRRLTGLALTVGLAGAGVYFAGTALLAGAKVSIDAGELERGGTPAGRYVELTGQLEADDAVAVSEGSSKHNAKVYVPVVSPEWKPGQPVRVYLATYESWLDTHAADLASGKVEGILHANALPGLVVSSLADRGHPAPDHYWVLDYAETPEKQMTTAKSMFGIAGIIGLITAIAWAIAARREQKTA